MAKRNIFVDVWYFLSYLGPLKTFLLLNTINLIVTSIAGYFVYWLTKHTPH